MYGSPLDKKLFFELLQMKSYAWRGREIKSNAGICVRYKPLLGAALDESCAWTCVR